MRNPKSRWTAPPSRRTGRRDGCAQPPLVVRLAVRSYWTGVLRADLENRRGLRWVGSGGSRDHAACGDCRRPNPEHLRRHPVEQCHRLWHLQILDAGASSGGPRCSTRSPGGPRADSVIATATPTFYGWLAQWNTTTWPTAPIPSRAWPPTPSLRAHKRAGHRHREQPGPFDHGAHPVEWGHRVGDGRDLGRRASANVTSVNYEITGGAHRPGHRHRHAHLLRLAGPVEHDDGAQRHLHPPKRRHLFRWRDRYESGRHRHRCQSGPCRPCQLVVHLDGVGVGRNGCGFVYLTFDAVYPGSAAVGNVTLHIAGCVTDPYTTPDPSPLRPALAR